MLSTTMKKSQLICFTEEAEFLRVNISMSDKVKKLKKKKGRKGRESACGLAGSQARSALRVIIRQITVSRA